MRGGYCSEKVGRRVERRPARRVLGAGTLEEHGRTPRWSARGRIREDSETGRELIR